MTDELTEPAKVDLETPDLAAANRAAFEQQFPGVLADGVVDAERLKELLDVEVVGAAEHRERYGLMWAGKKEAVRSLQAPSRGTLIPDFDESVNWDSAQNVFIEGDNLEVLKLIQKAYNDKVKLIYIDPPYNTGGDFVYNDNFSDGLRYYLEYSGQISEGGLRTSTDADTGGRKHSRWLSMMYPRLALARNLLATDGIIAVSIDDNEVATLKLLLDEVFGPENFVATICVRSRASVSNDKLVSPSHNFIHIYARSFPTLFARRSTFGLEPKVEGFDQLDERGAYKLVPVDGPGGAKKGNPHYEFMGVEGYWRFSKETMQAKYDAGLIVVRPRSLQQKYYLDDALKKRRTATTWWHEGVQTSSATRALKELMGEAVFDNPKPVALIRQLVEMAANQEGAIVLDFFAGSGTTAHAVLEANANDNKGRRYICVTLPEATPESSTARAAGYDVVSDITLARLQRVMEGMSHSGLRVSRLAASNFRNASSGDPEDLFDLRESTLEDRDHVMEHIAQEVILKEGVRLDAVWERHLAAEAPVIVADGVAVVMSLDLTQEIADAALALEPKVVVFLEDGFAGADAVKANTYTSAKNVGIVMKTV
ncbi:site-specific DNA-methyltransferase [Dietzia cinnamea]|uniref:site-specific DNA-methyltransferase n=1 Tax=Dietzia cinnamea TaxID=321318 RepID=UPI0021A3AE51|nr:site-specific DNA-methyltransferase [Dietzia cinnamea]MCT2121742.1 site-specific DNA-methyltransferase [Dietzia cinnamea]MCT2145784.1 site-specific DNA-methyltransferase [Dietzia cinnamea]MCT2305396.1 site-specific DNA-methyltransferase [Dietzia cinnamea]